MFILKTGREIVNWDNVEKITARYTGYDFNTGEPECYDIVAKLVDGDSVVLISDIGRYMTEEKEISDIIYDIIITITTCISYKGEKEIVGLNFDDYEDFYDLEDIEWDCLLIEKEN